MSKIRELKLNLQMSSPLIRNYNSPFKESKDIKIIQKEMLIKIRPKRNLTVSNCFKHNIRPTGKRKPKKQNNNNNLKLLTYKTEDGYGNNHDLFHLKKNPPRGSRYYLEFFNLNVINIYSNSNNNYGILLKGSVPILFYNHLLIKIETEKTEINNIETTKKTSKINNNKKKLKRLLLTVRNTTKIVSIVFYSYGK